MSLIIDELGFFKLHYFLFQDRQSSYHQSPMASIFMVNIFELIILNNWNNYVIGLTN